MRRSLRLGVLFATVAAVASGSDVVAEAVAVGATLAARTLEDQHGETRSIDRGTRFVLFSRDMDGGDVIEEALSDAPEGFLEARSAVYVADISRMPGLVTRLFALPSMRRRPYPMLLDRTGDATADLPAEKGRATLVRLEALRVAAVTSFACTCVATCSGMAGARTEASSSAAATPTRPSYPTAIAPANARRSPECA